MGYDLRRLAAAALRRGRSRLVSRNTEEKGEKMFRNT